jgi:hypothetical protein
MLGHSINLYPYILFDAIDTEYFQMRFKVAGGPAAVTEHWYTQADQNPDNYYEPTVNTIFGCTINAYLNAGINLNVPITRYLALGGEFGFFHMSNGRTCMPNIGVNAIYGSLGVTATFNSEVKKTPVTFPDLPYGWAVNITGAAGAQKAAIEDPNRFLISSLHAGAVYHVNNWYAVGAGVDMFYNGAVTAILDWGVYAYNPYRHLYYDYHQDYHGSVAPLRPMVYETTHGASREEAFHYFRLGARCRIWDNMYFQTALKAHLNVAEFIEFGLGYQIPFYKKSDRPQTKGKVFHHHKDWWVEY